MREEKREVRNAKKSKLEELKSYFGLVQKSAASKQRTQRMIRINADIMHEENINNKK